MTAKPKQPGQRGYLPGTAMRVIPGQQAPGVEEVEAQEGVYIPAHIGIGTIEDDHADEDAPETLRGRVDDVDLVAVNPEWVLRRLVKEATDFGTRTRQSSRVKALELIGDHLGMFTKEPDDNGTEDERRAKLLSPEERREKIRELSKELKVS